jgi:phosphoglycerate dehydrogenase-like enzyme
MTVRPARVRVTCLGFLFDAVAQPLLCEAAPEWMDLAFVARPGELSDELLAASDVLMTVATVDDDMMGRAPRLRFIQKWGSGYDRIDVAAAERLGIAVAITAGANAHSIAEHTIMLTLVVLRCALRADRSMREGRWDQSAFRARSFNLAGKTVGIVGYGSIGREVARLADAFGAGIVYYSPSGPRRSDPLARARYLPLDELLSVSDIVTLHCPGNALTDGMIDRAALASMKRGAVLINTARGSIVSEPDLVAALKSGQLAGAGIDAFAPEPLPAASPLRALDNVVLTPHTAGMVMDDIVSIARHCFANITRFLDGEAITPADLVVNPKSPRAPRDESYSGRKDAEA